MTVYPNVGPESRADLGEPVPITAAQLAQIQFEDPEMVIEGLLPVGVHLLVGKPKKGKSWMGLGMCEAVATGGRAFGIKRVSAGTSLYLGLEDNPRRLRKRLKKVLNGRAMPERLYVFAPDRDTGPWPRLDQGGAEHLDEWLRHHPDTRLVVIDTLAKVRKPASGANVYQEDYAALEELLPIAHEHHVAIVVVYHLRKAAAADPMDEISSSTGLTAGVDGFLILRRVPGNNGPTLYVDGRDIEEPQEYALRWNLDTATWTIEGDAEEHRMSDERRAILEALRKLARPVTTSEVSNFLDKGYHAVRALILKMEGEGLVELHHTEGATKYYSLPDLNGPNSKNGLNGLNGQNTPKSKGDLTGGGGKGENTPSPESRSSREKNGSRESDLTDLTVLTGGRDSEAARRSRRLTAEEAEKVKRLIGEGMDPALARAEVLGEEVDLP